MIKIATVFSGIGAAEEALKQLGIEHEIVFACDNGERYLDVIRRGLKEKYQLDDGMIEEYLNRAIIH